MHDATETPITPPKKKKHRLLYWFLGTAGTIGFIGIVLFILFLWQLLVGKNEIVISPQTTHITAPLRANGMPNYPRWLDDHERKDVTAENNAAVLLWQAVRPIDMDMEEQHYEFICGELGIDPVPAKEDCLQGVDDMETFVRLATWLCEQRRLSVDGRIPTAQAIAALASLEGNPWDLEGDADEMWFVTDPIVEQAASRPWPSEGIAPLADWARENQRPLDLLVAASRRPRFYSPQPRSLDEQLLITNLDLPLLGTGRDAASALSIRAMWHLHEGRPDAAWEDIIALYRLARLFASGESLINILIGTSFEGIAHWACQSYLGSGVLTAEQARRAECDLNALPNLSSIANAINRGERMLYLDTVINLATDRVEGDARAPSEEIGIPPKVTTGLRLVKIDWNFVLSEGNRLYDRAVAAAELPTRAARQAAFAELDAELKMRTNAMQRTPAIAWALISRRGRGEFIANFLAYLLIPSIGTVQDSVDKANVNLELMRLSAALSVFRAENGHYPEKLDELVPGMVAALPIDIFSGKPPIYKADDDRAGFLLYSVGENGVDDGGTEVLGWIVDGEWREKASNEFDHDEFDQVLRFPVPPMKLPEVIPDSVTEDAADRATPSDRGTP